MATRGTASISPHVSRRMRSQMAPGPRPLTPTSQQQLQGKYLIMSEAMYSSALSLHLQ